MIRHVLVGVALLLATTASAERYRPRYWMEGGAMLAQPLADDDHVERTAAYYIALGVRLRPPISVLANFRSLGRLENDWTTEGYPNEVWSYALTFGVRYEQPLHRSVALFGEGALGLSVFEVDPRHPDYPRGSSWNNAAILAARAGAIASFGELPRVGVGAGLGISWASVSFSEPTFKNRFGDPFHEVWMTFELFLHVEL